MYTASLRTCFGNAYSEGHSFVMEIVGLVMTCRDMTGHVLTFVIFLEHVL